MTKQELYQKVNKTLANHPYIRYGQAVYNILGEEYPDIVNELNCTDLDPFYHDDRVEAFIDEVYKRIKGE